MDSRMEEVLTEEEEDIAFQGVRKAQMRLILRSVPPIGCRLPILHPTWFQVSLFKFKGIGTVLK